MAIEYWIFAQVRSTKDGEIDKLRMYQVNMPKHSGSINFEIIKADDWEVDKVKEQIMCGSVVYTAYKSRHALTRKEKIYHCEEHDFCIGHGKDNNEKASSFTVKNLPVIEHWRV